MVVVEEKKKKMHMFTQLHVLNCKVGRILAALK